MASAPAGIQLNEAAVEAVGGLRASGARQGRRDEGQSRATASALALRKTMPKPTSPVPRSQTSDRVRSTSTLAGALRASSQVVSLARRIRGMSARVGLELLPSSPLADRADRARHSREQRPPRSAARPRRRGRPRMPSRAVKRPAWRGGRRPGRASRRRSSAHPRIAQEAAQRLAGVARRRAENRKTAGPGRLADQQAARSRSACRAPGSASA